MSEEQELERVQQWNRVRLLMRDLCDGAITDETLAIAAAMLVAPEGASMSMEEPTAIASLAVVSRQTDDMDEPVSVTGYVSAPPGTRCRTCGGPVDDGKNVGVWDQRSNTWAHSMPKCLLPRIFDEKHVVVMTEGNDLGQ